MKRVLMASGLLGVLGCSTGSGALRPTEPSFSCEVPGYEAPLHYRAEVPMGRLEVVRLAAEAPVEGPPTPPTESESESLPHSPYRKRPHFPAVRLRVVAEAVPLGTLASALSRELGLGIVVAPRLVDLRVSVSLPDTTAQAFFGLLEGHYDVVATSGFDPVVVLEDRLEVLHSRYEVPELLVRTIPVQGLPLADVAAFYCKELAAERGSAYVIGDLLIVKGEQVTLERLDGALKALNTRRMPKDSSTPEASP